MKIVAFNCSPRMGGSNTDKIIEPLLEGAREAGAEVEKLYVRKLKIAPCTGCMTCWLKTPGVCLQKDDTDMAREKMMGADLIIFATPIYFFNMTSYMKNLMERTILPTALPFLTEVNGRFGHPTRFPDKTFDVLLVANAGFWGEDVFAPLLHTLDRCREAGVDEEGREHMHFVGNILVGFGEILQTEPFLHYFEPFFEELRKAGVELVEKGEVSQATCQKLAEPLFTYMDLTAEQAIQMGNTYFETMIKRAEEALK